jgi:hypothetical protein
MSERSASGHLPEKDKLGDKNWKSWSWTVQNLLTFMGWGAYIAPAARSTSSGTATPGAKSESTLDPDIDSKALAFIKMNVKEQNYPHIMNCKTAREAWHALESVHKAIAKAQQLQLSEQMETISMLSKESVTQYISRAKGLWLELQGTGSTKSEKEAVLATMRGLPENYDMVIRIFKMTQSVYTFDNLLPHLLADETMSRHHRQQEVTALFASGGRGRGSSRGRGRHNFHGGRGGSSNRSASTSRSNSDKDCNYCGHLGHIKSECRRKQRDESAGINRSSLPEAERQANKEKSLSKRNTDGTGTSTSASSSSKPNTNVTPVTLLALAAVTSRPSEVNSPAHWPLDSGASRHMSPFKELFSNLRPLDVPHIVKYGSGDTATCTHQGDIYLQVGSTPIVLKDVVYTPGLFTNLLSVVQANQLGAVITFGRPTSTSFTLEAPGVDGAITGTRSSDFYGLYGFKASYQPDPVLAAGTAQETPELWHRRMGHLGYDNLSKLPTMI